MSAQVRMRGPVHPRDYTDINTSYQEQACRCEDSQTGMDNLKNGRFIELHCLLLALDLHFCETKKIQTWTGWTRTV